MAGDRNPSKKIQDLLKTVDMGRNLIYYRETGSTNEDAKALAKSGAKHGTLVLAHWQKNGYGRRGRSWILNKGEGIAMTLILRPEFEPKFAFLLTLVMAISVARSMESLYGLEAKIKWPNDIIIGRKKVCGILTTMSADVTKIHYVLVGVGINCSVTVFPDELKDRATSIQLELGHRIQQEELIARCMENFEADYETLIKTKDLSLLLEEYNRRLIHLNQRIRVLDGESSYEGISRGINSLGELLVTTKNGETTTLHSGEISIRGLHGYL